MHPAADGLFTALQTAFAPVLEGRKKRIGFMRAELHPKLASTFGKHTLRCAQSFKPDYDLLAQAGLEPSPVLKPRSPMDVIIYLATRNREENKYMMAKGLSMLKPGGVFITAQHNTLGAKHLEKDLSAIAPEVSTHSKKHSRIMMAAKPAETESMLEEMYLAYGNPEKVAGTKLLALPGLFSWKKPDTGSQMLVDMIDPADLAGRGADFGAGWGFLSQRALKMSPRVQEMHLYEAEKLALDISAQNMALTKKAQKAKIHAHWADVPNHEIEHKFDFVLCNPPQHNVSSTQAPLAINFIKKAASCLKPNGSLWLVTNHHIPAEKHLNKLFSEVEECNRDKQYKVFRAEGLARKAKNRKS